MYPIGMTHRLIHKDGNQTREEILPVNISVGNMSGDTVEHCADGRVFICFADDRKVITLDYTMSTEEFEEIINQHKTTKSIMDFLLKK